MCGLVSNILLCWIINYLLFQNHSNQLKRKTITEEIETDIIYYYALMNTVTKKEKYTRRSLFYLNDTTRHKLRTLSQKKKSKQWNIRLERSILPEMNANIHIACY